VLADEVVPCRCRSLGGSRPGATPPRDALDRVLSMAVIEGLSAKEVAAGLGGLPELQSGTDAGLDPQVDLELAFPCDQRASGRADGRRRVSAVRRDHLRGSERP
jgi:hypothetical protein